MKVTALIILGALLATMLGCCCKRCYGQTLDLWDNDTDYIYITVDDGNLSAMNLKVYGVKIIYNEVGY